MRSQPRDNNNPANPLMKVAALTISRANEKLKERGSLEIDVSLNFKRSDDLRGTTRTKDGNEVTVRFGLQLSRATFELRIALDNGGIPPALKLTKVPFVQQLAIMREHRSSERTNDEVSSRVEGTATVRAKGVLGIPVARGLGKVKGRAARGTQRSTDSSTEYVSLGVSATHSHDMAHWEILPADITPSDQSSFLSGEVFLDPGSGESVKAGKITWNRKNTTESVEISGSVFVSMSDLEIGSVRITDENGDDIGLKQVSDGYPFQGSAAIKERLVRQIVRKHLVDQGMRTSGASVEICAARG